MLPTSVVDDPADALADAPYVHVTLRGSEPRVNGQPAFSTGIRIFRGVDLPDDGAYAAWTWHDGDLLIDHDPFGLLPLYEWRTSDSIALSTSPLKLLALGAPASLDHGALAVFLRMGFMLASDTPFESVRAVAPGRQRWSGNLAAQVTGYDHPRAQALTRAQALDGFIELFREAVRRRLPVDPEFVVPLSGGRDSRHILYELLRQGARPRYCVTIPRCPPTPPEDERVAATIAEATGVAHLLLSRSDSRFEAEHRKNWATGLCSDEHAWFVEMIDQLEVRGATTAYDGLGGSLSVASRFISPDNLRMLRQGRTDEVADRLLTLSACYTEDVLAGIQKRSSLRLSRERAVARLSAELVLHASAADPFRSFHLWSRMRRELALVPCGLMQRIPVVHTPLMDYELVRLLASVPAEVITPELSPADKSFHSDALRLAYPEWASLPFEDKKAPRQNAASNRVRFARETARYIVPRLRRAGPAAAARYLAPRLLCALGSERFAATRPWLPGLALYLFQLDVAARLRA
jgi:hypothetical protein